MNGSGDPLGGGGCNAGDLLEEIALSRQRVRRAAGLDDDRPFNRSLTALTRLLDLQRRLGHATAALEDALVQAGLTAVRDAAERDDPPPG